MNNPTPLLAFLRALDKESRDQFAAACGTTPTYLYQLAARERPNPQLSLAMALVAESRKHARKWMTEPLTFEGLLKGTKDA